MIREKQPLLSERTKGCLGRDTGFAITKVVANGTRHCEVALFWAVVTGKHRDARHDFRHHEVQIRIALAVNIRHFIDRRTTHPKLEILAVHGIKTPVKHLVSFALPTVLSNEYAWHDLKQIPARAMRCRPNDILASRRLRGAAWWRHAVPHDAHFLVLLFAMA